MEEKENISLEEKFINDITEFKENYIRMPRNSKAIENLFYVSNGIFYYPCLKFFSNLEKQLNELGINQQMEYSWGKISSDYDARSNVSSIDIMYF